MLILGIETSCDETAAAVVNSNNQVLSNIVSSSLPLHKRFGGIIPEIASRAHIEAIAKVAGAAISRAKTKLKDIKLICVTKEPGLPGALLVGISFARALSFALKVPILELDHLRAHIYANFLGVRKPKFPFIGFVISGGHTHIFLVRSVLSWKNIGSTRDDAVGEAYDKVAKIMGLGFPGGPIIEKVAKGANVNRVKLSCADFNNSLDLSFSGIKTAVYYRFQHLKTIGMDKDTKEINDTAASFQKNIVDILTKKAIGACRKYKIRSLVIGGGVTVNNFLRETLSLKTQKEKIDLFFPQKKFCLDNAAMVAIYGNEVFKKG